MHTINNYNSEKCLHTNERKLNTQIQITPTPPIVNTAFMND